METILPPMVFFLLVLCFKAAHAGNKSVNFTTPANGGLNLTEFTTASILFNSTGTPATILTSTEATAVYSSTKRDNKNFTTSAAATKTTSQHETTQSSTILTSPTDSGPPKSTTPTVPSSTLTVTTQTIQTTTHLKNTSDTPESSTVNSSHSITTSTDSMDTTGASRLNISEKNMTIIFSGMLGFFAVSIVLIMFYKCKHKFYYLHQPLNNTDDTDGFAANEDTLVISGGLYDGHPIYDNVPPTPAEPSQFRLQFLQ